MSDLRFVVVRDYNGKPVRNAAVVLHPVNKNGKQSRGGLELKTDNDGRTNIDGIPYGPLRIQVLAPGFQTFGEDYQIDKPEMMITVKLKRPGGSTRCMRNTRTRRRRTTRNRSDQWSVSSVRETLISYPRRGPRPQRTQRSQRRTEVLIRVSLVVGEQWLVITARWG